MKRIALQFTPYSWTDFDWRPLSSLRRWLCMLGVIAIVSTGSVVYTYTIWYLYICTILIAMINTGTGSFTELHTGIYLMNILPIWSLLHYLRNDILCIFWFRMAISQTQLIRFMHMMSHVYIFWYDKHHITFCFHSLFSVFNCWVEYILPEVCVVASPRALPQSNASGFLPFYGGSSHERNIPISGWSVSRKLSDMQYTGTPFPSNLL